jgi:hypothetical protein
MAATISVICTAVIRTLTHLGALQAISHLGGATAQQVAEAIDSQCNLVGRLLRSAVSIGFLTYDPGSLKTWSRTCSISVMSLAWLLWLFFRTGWHTTMIIIHPSQPVRVQARTILLRLATVPKASLSSRRWHSSPILSQCSVMFSKRRQTSNRSPVFILESG